MLPGPDVFNVKAQFGEFFPEATILTPVRGPPTHEFAQCGIH
jgi:hypothetical protein